MESLHLALLGRGLAGPKQVPLYGTRFGTAKSVRGRRFWATARASRARARWIRKGGFTVTLGVRATTLARHAGPRIRRRPEACATPVRHTSCCTLSLLGSGLWRHPPRRGDPAEDNATSCGAPGDHRGREPPKERRRREFAQASGDRVASVTVPSPYVSQCVQRSLNCRRRRRGCDTGSGIASARDATSTHQ